jgi:hypothetical protein
MWLRLVSTIVPNVCALALVVHAYPGHSSDHPVSIRDSDANVTRVADDHAETVGCSTDPVGGFEQGTHARVGV